MDVSLVSVVFCQVCDRLITRQRSPTECGVSEYDRESSVIRRPWPTGAVAP
jgi:hypothetical protein